ncbi:MAG UNVERIFIED_CONTAM: signal recognition particle protein, partial [Rickettsiaceae bacterium]
LYADIRSVTYCCARQKINELEEFRASSIASRILGMGDIVSLVEEAANNISREDAEKTMNQIKKGQFSLIVILAQLRATRENGWYW